MNAQRSARQDVAARLFGLSAIMNSKRGKSLRQSHEAVGCDVLFLSCQHDEQGRIDIAVVDGDSSILLRAVIVEQGEWLMVWGVASRLVRDRLVMVWDIERMEKLLSQFGVTKDRFPFMMSLQELYGKISRRKINSVQQALENEGIDHSYEGSEAAQCALQMAALVEEMAQQYVCLIEHIEYLKIRNFG